MTVKWFYIILIERGKISYVYMEVNKVFVGRCQNIKICTKLKKHYRDAYFNFSIFHINFLHFFKIKRYAQIPKRLFVYFVHRKATLNNRKALEKAERI